MKIVTGSNTHAIKDQIKELGGELVTKRITKGDVSWKSDDKFWLVPEENYKKVRKLLYERNNIFHQTIEIPCEYEDWLIEDQKIMSVYFVLTKNRQFVEIDAYGILTKESDLDWFGKKVMRINSKRIKQEDFDLCSFDEMTDEQEFQFCLDIWKGEIKIVK